MMSAMKEPTLGGDNIIGLSLAFKKERKYPKKCGDLEHFKKYYVFEKR